MTPEATHIGGSSGPCKKGVGEIRLLLNPVSDQTSRGSEIEASNNNNYMSK